MILNDTDWTYRPASSARHLAPAQTQLVKKSLAQSADPNAPHVHAVKLIIESENNINLTFRVTAKGKESLEELRLERSAANT